MKLKFLFLGILGILTACRTPQKLTTTQQDSTHTEIREKVVFIPDTVLVEIPSQITERTTRDTTSHLENDYATSDARVNSDGSLYHNLKTKPQKKPVPVETPVIRKDSIVYRDRAVKELVPIERELSKWQKTQMRGFWVVLVVLVVYVFRKPIFTLIRRFI